MIVYLYDTCDNVEFENIQISLQVILEQWIDWLNYSMACRKGAEPQACSLRWVHEPANPRWRDSLQCRLHILTGTAVKSRSLPANSRSFGCQDGGWSFRMKPLFDSFRDNRRLLLVASRTATRTPSTSLWQKFEVPAQTSTRNPW